MHDCKVKGFCILIEKTIGIPIGVPIVVVSGIYKNAVVTVATTVAGVLI